MALKFSVGRSRVSMRAGWESDVIAELRPEWDAAAQQIEDYAKGIVPVDTGELQKSIKGFTQRYGPRTLAAVIQASALHAAFVEYGTGAIGQATSMPPQVGDLEVPSTYVHSGKVLPGGYAQPYLRPAVWLAARARWAPV